MICPPILSSPDGCVGIYVHAEDGESACRKLEILSSCMPESLLQAVNDVLINSRDELTAVGVSEDYDFRIFVVSSRDRKVTQWVETSIFLSVYRELIGKWMSLHVARTMSSVTGVVRWLFG